jgi:excisionase family DNA binding protein
MSSPVTTGHQLKTVRDVAQQLQVSQRTVRRFVASGRLEVLRIGRRVRVAPETISCFLEHCAGHSGPHGGGRG